mmetsp:Transcript_7558/g.46475  ORF Transcript_7558/g.46475 Transcript_7558/m.46475 type:complete len:203 (-) Transcript_7558:349-957(-)
MRKKGYALWIPVTPPVSKHEIGVFLHGFQHPRWEGDVLLVWLEDASLVTHVAPTRMERHHCLHRKTCILHHLQDTLVSRPVVLLGSIPFHDPPPDIDHDSLHTGSTQGFQSHSQGLRMLGGDGSVGRDCVQGQHHIDRHSSSSPHSAGRLPSGPSQHVALRPLYLHLFFGLVFVRNLLFFGLECSGQQPGGPLGRGEEHGSV